VKIGWAVFTAQFRMLLQYRGAAFGGILTQIFFGLIMVMIYRAFYASGVGEQPLSISQVVTYIWLNQALFAMQPWRPDGEVQQMIRTGNVAYELVRPCRLQGLWLARAVAIRSAPTFLRAAPMVPLALLFFGMQLPASAAACLAFLVSLLAALLLSASITVAMNGTLFWTISGQGITMLTPAVIMVLSGQNIPLPLYPDWLQGFLDWQPFRGLLDVPARLYTGSIPPAHAPFEIGRQLVWVCFFVWLGDRLVKCGSRRLVVQGG